MLERSATTPAQRLRLQVDRWSPSLHGLAYRILGDHGRAEEVVADAFAKLVDSPVLQRPDEEVAAWLRRVTFNGALNVARGERRARSRVDRAGRLEGVRHVPDPGEEVVAAEDRALVRAVLASLSDRHAALLLLRADGCSYAEIAAAVDCAPGSVGTLLARAERAFTAAYTTATTTGGLS